MAAQQTDSSSNDQQPKKLQTLLWVARGHEGYGVASTIMTFSKALKMRGWQVEALCLAEGILKQRFEEEGITVHCLQQEQAPKTLSGGFFNRVKALYFNHRAQKQALQAAKRMLQGRDITVVQTCNMLMIGLTGALAKHLGAKAVWRMANSIRQVRYVNYPRFIVQLQCYFAKVVPMANSAYTASSLGKGLVQACVNHHGCDPERFNPDTVIPYTRKELGIPENATVFMVAARLDESGDKGQHLLIKALQAIPKEVAHYNIHILLLGGPLDTVYAGQLREAGQQGVLQQRIVLRGNVIDIECYYGAIDIAVNCRITAEPFGLSVIEAMMMGRPVLAHGLGGPAETVKNGITGWLAAPNVNDISLASAIRTALTVSAQPRDIGMAAREHAAAHYVVGKEVDRWLLFNMFGQTSKQSILDFSG